MKNSIKYYIYLYTNDYKIYKTLRMYFLKNVDLKNDLNGKRFFFTVQECILNDSW